MYILSLFCVLSVCIMYGVALEKNANVFSFQTSDSYALVGTCIADRCLLSLFVSRMHFG